MQVTLFLDQLLVLLGHFISRHCITHLVGNYTKLAYIYTCTLHTRAKCFTVYQYCYKSYNSV